MADIHVYPSGKLLFLDKIYQCALGQNGIIPADEKEEGDRKTPAGSYPVRYVLYRDDRIQAPEILNIPCASLAKEDGWCDDCTHPSYNQQITRPFFASHEKLYRDDSLYDIIVVIGHNDDPIEVGKGSAVFFHIAREDYRPTYGCVAVSCPDMLEILTNCDDTTQMIIHSEEM